MAPEPLSNRWILAEVWVLILKALTCSNSSEISQFFLFSQLWLWWIFKSQISYVILLCQYIVYIRSEFALTLCVESRVFGSVISPASLHRQIQLEFTLFKITLETVHNYFPKLSQYSLVPQALNLCMFFFFLPEYFFLSQHLNLFYCDFWNYLSTLNKMPHPQSLWMFFSYRL